ncbi:MAG: 2-oxoacid:acceptor oxidoreductase family protein [Thermoguttaceae bacterium]
MATMQKRKKTPVGKSGKPAAKTVAKAAKAKVAPSTTEILLAGSGGQGMILIGKLVAQAAVAGGYNATYIPSYGAEVRGGTAHCHVKVGRRPIGSPIVEDATIFVAMNEPSYKAFAPLLRKGSTLVANASLIPTIGKHAGVKVLSPELTKIAAEMGSLRSANMLVFGLCVGLLGLNDKAGLHEIISDTLGKKNPAMLEMNQRIFDKGVELGRAAAAE